MSSEASSGLTSTTAPGKIFSSRAELASHYKSDWHKYNLKRREAGLPLLEEVEFQARWEAALALRNEKEKSSAVSGTDHLKNNKKLTKKQQLKQESKKQKASKAVDHGTKDATMEDAAEEGDNGSSKPTHHVPAALAASQENPEIDPLQSLFDAHKSETLEGNVEYMHRKFGFFIPDRECLADLEGLLGYCHEKIKLGHYCLYCEK
jgi:pre-60S factor REI1